MKPLIGRLSAVLVASLMLPSVTWSQGFVDNGRCPAAAEGKADGNGGGQSDAFTYESSVRDIQQPPGRRFFRCIENQARKRIWTHWKGVLSESYIDVGQRLSGYTELTRAEVEQGIIE